MSGLLNAAKDLKQSRLDLIWIPAMVVENDDPQQTGRVKIRIRLIHRGITDVGLPWARPWSLGGQGAAPGIGGLCVPPVGSKVLVRFLDDSNYFPVYVANFNDKTTIPSELLENYPNTYGRSDAAGNLWVVNTSTNNVRFIHQTGAYHQIDGNGNINVVAAGDMTFSAPNGNVTLYAGKNLTMFSAETTTLDGSTLQIAPDNSPSAPNLTVVERTKPTAQTFSNQEDY